MNRRKFLRSSVVTAGAVCAFPFIVRSAENRKLRVALIGVGGRGEYAIRSLADEKVVALCDVDTGAFTRPHRKRNTPPPATTFPQAKQYQDYREMFEHADDFDAVWISIPDHHHYPASLRAIRAGKAVYCEKPLAWSVWEAQQLAVEAEKHKVPTQMGNQGMANNGWRLAQAYITAGAIGRIREVHTSTGTRFDDGHRNPTGEDPVPEGLDWDLWLGPAPVRPYKEGLYDGKNKPPRPAALEEGRQLKGVGSYFVGTKGTLWLSGGYNETALLIPASYRKSFGKQEIVIPQNGHSQEFIEAAKGLIPYNAPLSHSGYGGMLTATALKGNIATRVKGKLLYDSGNLRFTTSEQANKLLTRKPREGWYI